MKQKELSRLSRLELLELLIQQSKEVERLTQELNELKEQINKREILIEEVGTLAEASLQLSGIFEAAQEAANIYLENVKNRNEFMIDDSDYDSDELLSRTQQECELLKEETQRECKKIVEKARQEIQDEWLEFNRYKQMNMFKK